MAGEDGEDGEESEADRLERNFSELLQELRVAQAGIQILFAFLLTVVFTPVFERASAFVRDLHLITVLLAAGATAALTAPAAWHRVLFRRGRRIEILRAANRFAVAGLVLLAGAMTCTVLLVATMTVPGWRAELIGVVGGVVFFGLWFAMPLPLRNRRNLGP
ncbi:MAG TPA: DUF6328 family protein [Pseudonocardiaceae bacterium]|jgi:hypothetical protein